MASPTAVIHGFYRAWFTWVDSLTLVGTVLGCIFTPELMTEGFIPAPLSQPNPDHAFLFHQLAALYGFMIVIMTGVLRACPSDLKVWRIVTGGILLVDISIIASMFASLGQQGRLDCLASWRWQEWGNLLYTGGVATIRALFLAGVGVRSVGKGGEKKRA